MAVKTKDELMELLKTRLADDTSDDALSLIEDFDDTLNKYETDKSDGVDWKTKYEKNDADWRQRYKDRFFSKPAAEDDAEDAEEEEKEEPRNFADLFTN